MKLKKLRRILQNLNNCNTSNRTLASTKRPKPSLLPSELAPWHSIKNRIQDPDSLPLCFFSGLYQIGNWIPVVKKGYYKHVGWSLKMKWTCFRFFHQHRNLLKTSGCGSWKHLPGLHHWCQATGAKESLGASRTCAIGVEVSPWSETNQDFLRIYRLGVYSLVCWEIISDCCFNHQTSPFFFCDAVSFTSNREVKNKDNLDSELTLFLTKWSWASAKLAWVHEQPDFWWGM